MSAQTIIAVYDAATGEIRRTVTCPPEMVAVQAQAGERTLAVQSLIGGDVWRVDLTNPDAPVLVERTALAGPSATSVAVGAVVTWPGIPGGTEVVVSGPGSDQWTHDAGDVEIAFGAAGTYVVRFFAQIPFRNRQDSIHASA